MRRTFFRLFAAACVATLMALPQGLAAQTSSILYGSTRNPLMNSVNPAFFPARTRVYLSLPGANIGLSSPLAYSSIFHYDSVSQKTQINLNSLLDTLTDNGNIRFGTSIHAIGLGVDCNRFLLTFSTQAKFDLGFEMPSGLATFFNEGNYNYVGDNYLELLNGDLISMRLYGEAALGFGFRINDNWTVGIRAKALMGYLDLSNNASSVRLYTAEDYSYLRGVANLDINLSTSIMEVEYDSVDNKVKFGDINSFVSKNMGVNFDLGVRYATDRFEVSASILDIGPGIHWKEGVNRVITRGGNRSFTFSGADVSDMLHGGEMDSAFVNRLIDSLKTLTDIDVLTGEDADYWTSIPMKINLGGMFNFNKHIGVGAHFHGEFGKMGKYSNTSLLARAGLFDWVEVVVSASVLTNNGNWDWFNPGVGITLTPAKTLQFYAMMDYISRIYIVDAKSVSLTMGMNLLIGRTNKR